VVSNILQTVDLITVLQHLAVLFQQGNSLR